MTKRIIDADALLAWVNINTHDGGWNGQASVVFEDELIEKINELATPAPEPQTLESIYDAQGWCWDLSLIDKNEEYHFLIESHREGVGYKVTDKKSYYQRIGLTWFIEENLEQNESLGDKIIAWRPLPPLPTTLKEV